MAHPVLTITNTEFPRTIPTLAVFLCQENALKLREHRDKYKSGRCNPMESCIFSVTHHDSG